MVKEKVLDYANKISRTKRGSKSGIRPEHPEYRVLEHVVTEEMAEVGLQLEFRNPLSVADIAKKCGKPVKETEDLLWELAMAGAAFISGESGEDKYWHDIWVPGHMEMIANSRENVEKYPEIAQAFNDYGIRRGPMGSGVFSVGSGPMRVIPIETAIEGETRRASYEEVSKYLDEHDLFSVSDCSCRASREAMGEGCGHLKEDMCIQLGSAAEFYIRTGRGREIDRKEAYEIIHRAEENGLMHQIPNVDGPGITHAICNCCGCSCFALRIATMFKNNDMVRSNYISSIDEENCVGCGECVTVCPVNALKLGQKLCTITPIVEEKQVDFPHNSEWGPDKWNPDYRLNREMVVDSGTSPCITECPAHISVPGYIKLAAQGKYKEALELIKQQNPFPAVCGRICPRSCESECTRADIDDAVAIDDIKKFIAEQELYEEHRFVPKKRHAYGNKIAVIGAGPSGLSCAYYLAIDGYDVTVFEKEEVLGGMLTLGIPSFRLEKDVINAEIDILKELDVKFKTGVEIGKDLSIEDLRTEGYEAFYLAIGAQGGKMLGLEGEQAKGVRSGVEFLKAVNLGEDIKLDGKVLVIGGGNVAIDVARAATRVGASSVEMFCLECQEEMPALEEEIEEAVAEDITINNSWGPKRIIEENGQLVGVEFQKCISVFDQQGKFSPTFDESQSKVIKTNHLLISIGQGIEWGNLLEASKVELNPNQTIKADGFTLQTGEPDIFTGGDVLTGPMFAIDAIATGKEGAISIHRYVQPGQSLVLGRDRRVFQALDKDNLNLDGYDNMPRQRPLHVDGQKSKETFEDLRTTLTEEQMKIESERCLGCGVTVVDSFACVGCGACTTKCKFDAISLVRKYDAGGLPFEKIKPQVIRNTIKRKGVISARKAGKAISSIFK